MHATSAARLSTAHSSAGTQANRRVSVIQFGPNGRVRSDAGSFANSFSFDDENGVPGLGFDYPHLAAISGGLRNNFGGHGHHEHNFVTPIFFGGFPYYDYTDFTDYQQVQQQPQIIVIQQPAPAVAVQQETPASQVSAPAISAAAPAAPVRDVGEFILVRRDGKVLFASAFSVIGTQLQYITPEGIRRTLPFAELDAVATQDMNEARGTSVQFHN
jgi:hypothetical protein